jgi:hypothetical protein
VLPNGRVAAARRCALGGVACVAEESAIISMGFLCFLWLVIFGFEEKNKKEGKRKEEMCEEARQADCSICIAFVFTFTVMISFSFSNTSKAMCWRYPLSAFNFAFYFAPLFLVGFFSLVWGGNGEGLKRNVLGKSIKI